MDITMGIFFAMMIAAPLFILRYVRGLPIAPACPSCSAITRAVHYGADPFRLIPYLTATSIAECTRCGWHGRMRWRWAPHAVRRPPT